MRNLIFAEPENKGPSLNWLQELVCVKCVEAGHFKQLPDRDMVVCQKCGLELDALEVFSHLRRPE